MANIISNFDSQNNLVVVNIEGSLSIDEVRESCLALYEENLILGILWDITRGSIKNIAGIEFKKLANEILSYAEKHKRIKTAFVVATDVDFGISRIFEAYINSDKLPVSHRTFWDKKVAVEWFAE